MEEFKAGRFRISGETAFFKKPDVNKEIYFTYNNIHKVALLGVLGAILGLGGHIQQKQDDEYPEFYEKLKDLKVSIMPLAKKGYFSKKIQYFNNSVGYANYKNGNGMNLQVKEQWLENPKWDVFFLYNSLSDKKLMDEMVYCLKNKQCEYIPYLGKNDHVARIEDFKEIKCCKIEGIKDIDGISSLFVLDDENINLNSYITTDDEQMYVMREISPVGLNAKTGYYEYKELIFTNAKISLRKKANNIYNFNGRLLYFI